MREYSAKMAAIAVIAMMSAAVFLPMIADDGRMADDSSAVAGLDDAFVSGFVIGFIVGGVAAGSAVWVYENFIKDMKNASDEASCAAEAAAVRDIIETADGFYENALSNYAQIWGYASEHFVRQSELAASVVWTEGARYDPESVMLYSGTYVNSAMMLANAVSQIDEFYGKLSARVTNWQSSDVFSEGNMRLTWDYGSSNVGGTVWTGKAGYSAAVPSEKTQKVFFAGGGMTVLGGEADVTVAGRTVALTEGANADLPAGVYALQGGRTYMSDRIIPVIDADTADVRASLLMGAPDDRKLAVWDGGKVLIDGVRYDSVSLTVSPKGSGSRTVDVTCELSARAALMKTVVETVEAANTSAAAVWGIYEDAGHASAYLTTLAVPNQYHNVDMTETQKRIMTALSMRELSDFWQSSGGTILKVCKVSPGSNLLFVRGDIKDSSGRVIAEDAVFTPYYMVSDQSLNVGENVQSQHSICAVWKTGHSAPLSAWDGGAGDKSSLVETGSGYVFEIAEILYDGENVQSVDLDVRQIDYIKASELAVSDPVPPPARSNMQMVTVAMCLIGILCAAAGFVSGRWALAAAGASVVIVGVLFGGEIQGFFDRFGRLGGFL